MAESLSIGLAPNGAVVPARRYHADMGETPVAASEAVDAPPPARRFSISAALDGFFFVFAGIASVWLAWLVLTESFGFGWSGIAFFVLFWLVLAYLVLPRLH